MFTFSPVPTAISIPLMSLVIRPCPFTNATLTSSSPEGSILTEVSNVVPLIPIEADFVFILNPLGLTFPILPVMVLKIPFPNPKFVL